MTGLRVQLWPGTYREPDIVFVLAEYVDRLEERYWRGADLAMEIVTGSREDCQRDLVQKKAEYAEADISEYWIVDPREKQITVLRLVDDAYKEHGVFSPGTTATSALLPGFAVDVTAVFQAANTRKITPPARPTRLDNPQYPAQTPAPAPPSAREHRPH